jgi:ATP-dependent Lhr-like helicase
MEEAGRVRRGYFVAGLGATQFALPGAVDLLRSLRTPPEEAEVITLAAADPASPYGSTLKFPSTSDGRSPSRSVGATVFLVDGSIVAWLARGDRQLTTWLPDTEPQRSRAARGVAHALLARARTSVVRDGDEDAIRGMLIEEIDGLPPALHPLAPFLVDAGFLSGALGFQATRDAVTAP